MAEQVDAGSGPTRRLEEDGDVAVRSESEVDLTIIALIRQALEASGSSSCPVGSGDGVGYEGGSAGRIGKFEVLGVIGRGGFGTVLLVRDPDLGRERALKVPNPETLGSPGALSRFLGEARLAARVDHPNVVRVYEASTLGAFPYIVMEYCPGGSLGQWLAARSNGGPLPQRWVAALVGEIAEGVHQAHLAGLLHRDIKPANILLERIEQGGEPDAPRFRPKIADFGLAKVFERDGIGRSTTAPGTPLGTWAYMSPEQARGDKEIRATTDVYAIGAILRELLTGERPYAGLTQPAILSRLLAPDPLPSPRTIRRDLHRDLETIARKCLEKATGDRYQNPSELANDLRRHLDGLPILARPTPPWRQGLATVRRHPVRSGLAGMVLTSVVVGLLAWSEYRGMKRRGQVDVLLNNLASASVAQFPELIPRIDPTDDRVADRLNSFFDAGGPTQKLAAALVLARDHPEYRLYSYDRLLAADPREIEPIARLLRDRMPNLTARLAAEADSPAPPGTPAADAEAQDRRRANAANALICLDPDGPGWKLLRFQPDPQARSFLIHQLGPSGVDSHVLHEKLIAKTTETSIRLALIQALGEIPPEADPGKRDRATSTVLDLFRDDPDSGIHGSAKWLLRKWNRQADVAKVDEQAQLQGPREGFRWRVSRSGLTFLKVDDPETGRVIEVSDTEVPRDLFLEFVPGHPFQKEASPGADCPITGINYQTASIFCNKLTDLECIPNDQRCYGAPSKYDVEPVPGALDRSGYRLPTDREFRLVCRAGTTTRRYHGDSTRLLPAYAWYDSTTRMRTFPVASLKPNEFGLFDALGNASEICHLSGAPDAARMRAVACGGSVRSPDFGIHHNATTKPTSVSQAVGLFDYGLRIARTVQVGFKNQSHH